MNSTILDLHGLTPQDAIEIVQRKIQRALRAGCSLLKLVYSKDSAKLKRYLDQYLSTTEVVKDFESDAEMPGVTWVYLQPL